MKKKSSDDSELFLFLLSSSQTVCGYETFYLNKIYFRINYQSLTFRMLLNLSITTVPTSINLLYFSLYKLLFSNFKNNV